MMATYRVPMRKVMWTSVEVEADDEEAAIEKAFESDAMPPSEVCAQCSGWGQKWYVDDGEWDMPDDMSAELIDDSAESS